jgi:hypothetical protein
MSNKSYATTITLISFYLIMILVKSIYVKS